MDTAALSEALFLGKLILGLTALMALINSALSIAAFFRRQPSIDATLTAIIKEFNQQLQDRVLVRDFDAAEARQNQHVRDLESRVSASMLQVEHRMDQRLSGMHSAIVDIRSSMKELSSELSKTLQDLYNDRGWTRGKLDKQG